MITIEKNAVTEKIITLFRAEWPVETAGLLLEPNTPIFYEGIGLDSVDGATLLLALEEAFDIEIEKEALGQDHFQTIGTLSDFIIQLTA
jgi:acyl carrier protein